MKHPQFSGDETSHRGRGCLRGRARARVRAFERQVEKMREREANRHAAPVVSVAASELLEQASGYANSSPEPHAGGCARVAGTYGAAARTVEPLEIEPPGGQMVSQQE